MGNEIDIQTGEYVKLYFQKAGVGRRILATVIDWLMYVGIIYATFQITDYFSIRMNDYLTFAFYAFMSTIGLFSEYFSKGYTVGKLVTGIRLINDQCTPPTFMQCFLRWLLFCVDFWFVGAIFIGKNGQRLGDMASGIQCIYVNEQGQKDVDLNHEFEYTEEDYIVRYPEVKDFKPETILNIQSCLYNKNNSVDKISLCANLRKHLNIRYAITDNHLLEQVYNDYKHMQINGMC